jgi:ketosteroid isomerase-like protein
MEIHTDNIDDAALLAYRRIAEIYAHQADRGTAEAMAALFTEDAVLVSPDATLQGGDAISRIPTMLRDMFAATRHEILNQTIELRGDNEMSGETYCNALHLLHPDGDQPRQLLGWSIRYQDKLRFTENTWKIARRELVLDWTEMRTVRP